METTQTLWDQKFVPSVLGPDVQCESFIPDWVAKDYDGVEGSDKSYEFEFDYTVGTNEIEVTPSGSDMLGTGGTFNFSRREMEDKKFESAMTLTAAQLNHTPMAAMSGDEIVQMLKANNGEITMDLGKSNVIESLSPHLRGSDSAVRLAAASFDILGETKKAMYAEAVRFDDQQKYDAYYADVKDIVIDGSGSQSTITRTYAMDSNFDFNITSEGGATRINAGKVGAILNNAGKMDKPLSGVSKHLFIGTQELRESIDAQDELINADYGAAVASAEALKSGYHDKWRDLNVKYAQTAAPDGRFFKPSVNGSNQWRLPLLMEGMLFRRAKNFKLHIFMKPGEQNQFHVVLRRTIAYQRSLLGSRLCGSLLIAKA